MNTGFSPCESFTGGRRGFSTPATIVVLFLEINQRGEAAFKPSLVILSERSESKDLRLLFVLCIRARIYPCRSRPYNAWGFTP
jgi:hypothetical protein